MFFITGILIGAQVGEVCPPPRNLRRMLTKELLDAIEAPGLVRVRWAWLLSLNRLVIAHHLAG